MKQRALWLMWLIVLSVCAVLAQQPPAGDPPATREDVLKMFDAMNTRDQVRQVMEQVMQQMRSMSREQLKQRRPDISENELARMDRESEEIAKSFPVDEMMDDMIPVYQKHLTQADTAAIITFYSSPTGQKLLREMPALTSEGLQAAYPRMQKNLDAIMKRLDEKANPPKPKPTTAPKPPPEKQ